jgi:hypothetical protein
MIRKAVGLWVLSLMLAVACKKDCIEYRDYLVTSFSIQSNSNNLGLFSTDVRNSADTIRSVRNQFLFVPERDFFATGFSFPSFDLMSTAYARDCAIIERSASTFDPLKTTFSVDVELDLTVFGLSGLIPAGGNLLANQALRDAFLSSIQNNAELHNGLQAPFTVSPNFLRVFNGQRRTFTLSITSSTGDVVSASTQVFVQI